MCIRDRDTPSCQSPGLGNVDFSDDSLVVCLPSVAACFGDDFGAREIAIKPLYFARSRFAGILCLVSDPLTI